MKYLYIGTLTHCSAANPVNTIPQKAAANENSYYYYIVETYNQELNLDMYDY